MNNTNTIVDANIHEPETDYHFNMGRYCPPPLLVIGALFFCMGIYYSIQLAIPGFIYFAIGIIIIFPSKSLTVSFSLEKYRHTFSLFGLRLGRWQAFPKFEYVSVFSATKAQVANSRVNSTTLKHKEIEVGLVYNRNRKLAVYNTQDIDKAFDMAGMFAKKLDLRIYDATAREGVWVE